MSSLLGKFMRRKPSAESEGRQDNALALQHLRKLFSQFRNDSADARTQEQRLYSMVPLFNRVSRNTVSHETFLIYISHVCYISIIYWQVFESSPPSDMMDRFPEVLQFSSHVSKLLVSEIKKRAQDRSTGVLVFSFGFIHVQCLEHTQREVLLIQVHLDQVLSRESFLFIVSYVISVILYWYKYLQLYIAFNETIIGL